MAEIRHNGSCYGGARRRPIDQAAAEVDDDLFQQSLQEVDAELGSRPSDVAEPEKGLLDQAGEAWQSIGAGIGNAAIETKDFLMGEPEEADKSQFRKDWEAKARLPQTGQHR